MHWGNIWRWGLPISLLTVIAWHGEGGALWLAPIVGCLGFALGGAIGQLLGRY